MEQSKPSITSLRSGDKLVIHKGITYRVAEKDKNNFRIRMMGGEELVELGWAESFQKCIDYILTKDIDLLKYRVE